MEVIVLCDGSIPKGKWRFGKRKVLKNLFAIAKLPSYLVGKSLMKSTLGMYMNMAE